LKGLHEKAFWVYLNQEKVFTSAGRLNRADHLNGRYWKLRLLPAKKPDVTHPTRELLADAISQHYREQQGRGEHCTVEVYLRREKVHYFFAYPADYADTVIVYNDSGSEEGQPSRWLVVDKWRNGAATEDDRSEGTPQLLEEHQERAELRARQLARSLGLSAEHENILALAARLHDEGKRSPRWQRAFNAPKGGVYAKTEGPINQGLLDGYRHELGSLLQVERDARLESLTEQHRDLVLHLITTHHGFARPVIGTSGCEDAPPSVLDEKAAEIALRFARLQALWGPWGLAWWEALLRAADQLASRDNPAGSGAGGGV
jgi:hypothetical protein